MWTSSVPHFQRRGWLCRKHGHDVIHTLKAWILLHRFSWNSYALSGIKCRSLYWISPRSARKCATYGYKFSYAPKYLMGLAEPIFTKSLLDRQVFVNNCFTDIHENPIKGLVSDTRYQKLGVWKWLTHKAFSDSQISPKISTQMSGTACLSWCKSGSYLANTHYYSLLKRLYLKYSKKIKDINK